MQVSWTPTPGGSGVNPGFIACEMRVLYAAVLPQLGLMILLLLGLNELKVLNISNNAYSLVIIFKVLSYMVEKVSY